MQQALRSALWRVQATLGPIFPPTITGSLRIGTLRLRQGTWMACVILCLGKSTPVCPTEHWEIVYPRLCPSPFILPSRGFIGLWRWVCHQFPRRPLSGTSWLALPFALFLNVALENTRSSPPARPDLSARSAERKQDKSLRCKMIMHYALWALCLDRAKRRLCGPGDALRLLSIGLLVEEGRA